MTTTNWRKSTYSGAGNDCVELAVNQHRTLIRDSKNKQATHLAFGTDSFRSLIATVKSSTRPGPAA